MKKFRKNIKLKSQNVGFERRQDILDDIDKGGTYLPRGVGYEDMDVEFIKFIEGIGFEIDGEKLPITFQTILKWSEFTQTWQHADEYKNIKLPFITIVRLPNVQVGTNQNGLWNIPNRRSYVYYKVPTWDGNRKGIDLYKIPQPTSVDLMYEVRLFTDKMVTLNKFNEKIQVLFQSRQHYIDVNAHPMPVHLETIGDESRLGDLAKRKYYVQPFEMLLKGYILDEDEYIITPTINRALIINDIGDVKRKGNINSKVKYEIIYNAGSSNEYTINPDLDINLRTLSNQINVDTITFEVNNVVKTLPFDVDNTDTLKVTITRDDAEISSLLLLGYKR